MNLIPIILTYILVGGLILVIIRQKKKIGRLRAKNASLEAELALVKTTQLYGPDGRRV